MATFYDDFQRANGALGGDWATSQGTPLITNGTVYGAGVWAALNKAHGSATYQKATAHVYFSPASGVNAGPAVCVTEGGQGGYYVAARGASGSVVFAMRKDNPYTGGIIATVSLTLDPLPYHTCTLEWNQGDLIATLDGEHTLTATDVEFAGNLYAGIGGYNTTCKIADVRITTDSAISLSASPAVVGNYGGCSTIALTGTSTDWTPGTPGSPTFTVNHGTISAQEVLTATTASITYCPGDWLGPVTITDPSTGETTAIVVTSDPGTVPPGSEYQFTRQAVAMVNNTAGESFIERLFKPNTPIDVDTNTELSFDTVFGSVALNVGTKVTPAMGAADGLSFLLWDILNGQVAHTSAVNLLDLAISADTQLGLLQQELDELRAAPDWTLQDLLDLLRGTDDRSMTELYNLVGTISGADNQEVLDAIAALRGDTTSTVANILTSLGQIRTVNTWTLGDVKTWVEAIEAGSTDLTPVLDAIDDLSSQETTHYNNILTNIAGLGTVLTAINLTTGNIDSAVGVVDTVVDEILGKVDDISTVVHDFPPTIGPLTTMELGTPVALEEYTHVHEDMDGCIVMFGDAPSRARLYNIGGNQLMFQAGFVAFEVGDGHGETPQYLTFTDGIYQPRTCARASGVYVKPNQGQSGTVTPYLLVPVGS